ncbi:MAG TPA: hypothetical protein VGP36_23855 [Mycobacteriales bacterium]|nr:hypothetical protein [Mycobacteriales bacterium]
MPEIPTFTITALPGAGPGPVVELGPVGPVARPVTTLAYEAPAVPTLDALPYERETTFPGAAGTPFEGREYFYPLARVATRTPTSRVPAVTVEPAGDGWLLRVTLQLYRPGTIPATAVPLDVELRAGLRAPRPGELTTLTTMQDEAPEGPDVIRQIVLSGPVERAWIDLLKTETGMTLAVSGRPRYAWSDAAVQAESRKDVPYDPERVGSLLGPKGDLPFSFPLAERANGPVYAAVDGTAGTATGVWVVGPAGPWARTAAGDFGALPHEYRLAFDPEHGLPAVTVLLLAPEADGGEYRVRVRFHLVPWWDPELLGQLRTDIAESEGTPYPVLVTGGYDAVEFTPSTLFGSLGGDVLGQGTTAIDAQGFELVFDCSMEFYTLLCTMLAPATGVPTGLDGHVRFTLPTGADSRLTRDVPVHVRLDVLADGYLPVQPVPTGAGSVHELTATVRNLARAAVTATGAAGTLVVAGQPLTYPVPLSAQPLPLALAAAGSEGSSATLSLTTSVPVVADRISALDLRFTEITVAASATAVLEQVHELATATTRPTSVRVTSYQLAHPENLPAPLADLYGLEIEVRLGRRAPVTVFLTRTEPDKTVALALLIGDLVGGADPQQPGVGWRRRNLSTAGPGEFSPWQTTTGRELFVTPADH